MPSGLTHMLLVQYSRNELNHEELSILTGRMTGPLVIGSVAPDLPYASILDSDLLLTNETGIADRFHYECTNKIPLKAFQAIREERKKGGEKDLIDALFCFFAGYASHVIADGVVHPFVRDKVGDYAENKTAHRTLEMRLDVLLCDALSGDELNYADIKAAADYFNDRRYKQAVCAEFARLIGEVYGNKECSRTNQEDAKAVTAEKVADWIKGLRRLFEVADGSFPSWYRALAGAGIIYNNIADLGDQKDDYLVLKTAVDAGKNAGVTSNFLGGKPVHFLEDCVPRFYEKYLSFLIKAYEFVYRDGPALDETDLPPINLDTGRSLADSNGDDLSKKPVLWS